MKTGLKYRRIADGHNQKTAATVIGCTESHYGKVERGDVKLTLEDAVKLAAWLKCRPEDLL